MNNYPEVLYRTYDELEEMPLEDGSKLLTETCRRWDDCTPAQHWLLLPTGVPVAFLQSILYSHSRQPLVLADIEVRHEYRGAGLAREIVGAVEALYGERLHTTGSFTPLGAQALSWLPLLSGAESGVRFNNMNFVHDWTLLIPKHGL